MIFFKHIMITGTLEKEGCEVNGDPGNVNKGMIMYTI